MKVVRCLKTGDSGFFWELLFTSSLVNTLATQSCAGSCPPSEPSSAHSSSVASSPYRCRWMQLLWDYNNACTPYGISWSTLEMTHKVSSSSSDREWVWHSIWLQFYLTLLSKLTQSFKHSRKSLVDVVFSELLTLLVIPDSASPPRQYRSMLLGWVFCKTICKLEVLKLSVPLWLSVQCLEVEGVWGLEANLSHREG